MSKTTQELYDLLMTYRVNEAIDVAIGKLQTEFGITTGDFASHYFNDDKMSVLCTIFTDYIEAEFSSNCTNKGVYHV